MKPKTYEQTSVISGILSFFRWNHVVVISDKTEPQPVREFVKRLEILNSILTVIIELIDISNDKDVAEKLSNVKKSDTTVIILHCSASQVKIVLHSAEDLGLLDGARAWIVTESITEDSSGISRLPAGLLGVRLHRSCDFTMHTSSHDLLYDSLVVYAHAQTSFINTKGMISPSTLSSCYGDMRNRNITGNIDFFR
jgi:hypothetical protein